MSNDINSFIDGKPYIFVSCSGKDLNEALPDVKRIISSGFNIKFIDDINPTISIEQINIDIKNCSQFVMYVSGSFNDDKELKRRLETALLYKVPVLAIFLSNVVLNSFYSILLSNNPRIDKSDNNYFDRLATLLNNDCRNGRHKKAHFTKNREKKKHSAKGVVIPVCLIILVLAATIGVLYSQNILQVQTNFNYLLAQTGLKAASDSQITSADVTAQSKTSLKLRVANKGKYFYIESYDKKTNIATFYKTSLYDGTQETTCSFKFPHELDDLGGYIIGDFIFYNDFNPGHPWRHSIHSYNFVMQKDKKITPDLTEEEFQIADDKLFYYGSDGYICRSNLDGSNPVRFGTHKLIGGYRLFYIYKNYLFYISDDGPAAENLYMVDMNTNKETSIHLEVNFNIFFGGENDKVYFACFPGIYSYSVLNNKLSCVGQQRSDRGGVLYKGSLYLNEDKLTIINSTNTDAKTVAKNVESYFECDDNICYQLMDSKGNSIPKIYYVVDLKGGSGYTIDVNNDGTPITPSRADGTYYYTSN